LLALLLEACVDSPELLTVPSPVPVHITHPISLDPVRTALTACAKSLPDLALLVETQPSAFFDLSEVDLALWLGDKPDFAGFAAPLAQERIVLIVNSHNPLKTMDLSTLAQILTGQIATWQQIDISVDGEITLWIYPPENEIQNAIENILAESSRISPSAFIASDPEVLLKKVESDRNAIGFLPAAWLTSNVNVIEIQEVTISLPVLALAEQEPQGMARQMLACLQGPIGQENLKNYYRSESP
jgi:hypothetical protein